MIGGTKMAPLTRKAIQSVLGPSDDTMVAEIATTGASLEELEQAWAWVNSDEALINEGRSFTQRPNRRTN